MNRRIEKDIRICPCCNQKTDRNNMDFTRDCHGITFRLVCLMEILERTPRRHLKHSRRMLALMMMVVVARIHGKRLLTT